MEIKQVTLRRLDLDGPGWGFTDASGDKFDEEGYGDVYIVPVAAVVVPNVMPTDDDRVVSIGITVEQLEEVMAESKVIGLIFVPEEADKPRRHESIVVLDDFATEGACGPGCHLVQEDHLASWCDEKDCCLRPEEQEDEDATH